jgi:Lrp/AsnC family transcriptional regulator
MDVIDKKILDILQEDTTLAVADIATKVGLSTTPCQFVIFDGTD